MGENLGQHFLTNDKIAQEMVRAGEVGSDDTILEVGPGKGALTEKLLKTAGQVIAVEKDPRLIKHLQDRFKKVLASDTLQIVEKDIRDVDISEYVIPDEKYKIVANIPYYLTGELLQMFLSASQQPEFVVLLVQKEVAERIVTKDGKQSRLSISVGAYGKPTLVRSVSRSNFDPAPEVDSAILSVTNISRQFFANVNEDKFFSLVKKGFRHKRKKLVNNLADKNNPKERMRKVLEKCEVDTEIRAERVSLKEWKCILKKLSHQK